MISDSNEAASLEAENLTLIVACFGLKLLGWKVHRKIYCLETDAGLKYLKKTKLQAKDIYFISEALAHLQSRGFVSVPQFERSKNGEPFVSINSELYVMSDWYASQELDFEDLTDLSQAIRFLGEFHRCAAGFHPSIPNPERTCWLTWPDKLEERLRQLKDFRRLALAEKESSEFSRLFLRHFEPFYRQANLSLEALVASAYPGIAAEAAKARYFCHHDYSNRNVLRTDEQQLVLVDFDYCLLDLRIHDLINLLVRSLKHNQWRIELGKFIISEYHTINQLTPDELDVMYILLCWPQEYWQVGLQYYYEKLPWPKERFLKKLRHKINYQRERESFLQAFPLEIGVQNKPGFIT